MVTVLPSSTYFFFNAAATTQIYTLSLHDALPISDLYTDPLGTLSVTGSFVVPLVTRDRKSTRLNSSHRCISYAVFCLKKKKSTRNDKPTSHAFPESFYAHYTALPIARAAITCHDY